MKDFWNERFKNTEYAYGTEPNAFFKQHASYFKPDQKVLFISEGEGRNSVFLAKQGVQVFAMDFSEEGQKKALALAGQNQVQIDYTIADLNDYDFGDQKWDGIVSIFAHTPSKLRFALYARIATALKTGGVFLLESYTAKQLTYKTGGPSDNDFMTSIAELKKYFPNFEIAHAQEIDRPIEEGTYHKGMSAVVQWIAKK
jgi:cyclopropane fatty-acyl-phospholipid synthase-like methyltransferase